MKLVLFSVFFAVTSFAQSQPNVAPFTTKAYQGNQILANDKGLTLYTFDRDTGSTSNCYNGCAAEWPPALLSQTTASSVSAPLGTTIRKDQSVQVTYDGKPVYLYADDVDGDDVLGDGLGGIWHVVTVK